MKCTSSLETFLVFMFFWGGRKGWRERLGQNTSSIWKQKSCCSVFSSQHGKKITQQKGKGNVMFLPKEKQKPSPPNKREKEMWCFAKGKKQKPWPPNKREKGSWLLLLMGHMKKDRGIQSKLIFLSRILTQLSYEEYNDTKHPTTQSNDLVTSPCQLWNLNAFCCSFMIKYGYIRHDWEWALQNLYCSCTKVACTLLAKWFFICATQKNWGSKEKTVCT